MNLFIIILLYDIYEKKSKNITKIFSTVNLDISLLSNSVGEVRCDAEILFPGIPDVEYIVGFDLEGVGCGCCFLCRG